MYYYTYILTNSTNVAIYVGVTRDLVRRVYEHKHDLSADSYCTRYKIHKLVYYEQTNDPYVAISREKQLKSWSREKKNALVETMNPKWEDLYESILG